MRKLYEWPGAFLRNLNIRYKLLLSYLVLIFIPLSALATLTYSRSSEVVSSNMIDISSQTLEQANTTLGYLFQNAIKSSNIVSSNRTVHDALLKHRSGYDTNEQIDDFNQLKDYLTSIQFDQNVYRIRLYTEGETLYSNENVNLFSLHQIRNSELYKEAVELNGQLFWTMPYTFKYGGFDDTQRILSGVRVVINRYAYGEFIGLLSVDILVSDIEEILSRYTFQNNGSFYIVDQRNHVIASSGRIAMPVRLPDNEKTWRRDALPNGDTMLTSYRWIPYTSWKIVSVIPISTILEPNYDLRNYTFVVMLILAMSAYFFAVLISGSLVKRIRRLMKTMRSAEKGDLSVKADVSGKDEIGELEEKYNYMLEKINELADERYKIGKESKHAELRALQAQINPHFLYNTLELITCKALNYRAGDIVDLINLLAKFYRLSLSNGRDIIPIRDEIAHIETYVNIQNQRFEHLIHLEIDIDERLLDYSILKLILQPIVENSILHGIMEKEHPCGIVRIIGRFEQGDRNILLIVADDGVGMSDERLRSILTKADSRHEGNGFAIVNVQRRLQIHYGDSYGLTYRSETGKGTTVEVRLPAVFS
ncbi:MAG TPA: sensor histidine kinase [Paenibacillus sp.]|nr:sensor histidine kinase [Paenibacillus sp.]